MYILISPFLTAISQYTPAKLQLCRKIAKSTVHVERAKETYPVHIQIHYHKFF